MLRTGYVARVRPWRDYPGDVEIRWYKCPPGNRPLGVPSLFRSLHWESHPYLFAGALGEVFQSVTKVFPYRAPIGVTGQFHCGTDDDFSRGGTHDEFRPAYPRADDGIALCCRPPLGCLIIEGMGATGPGNLELDSVTNNTLASNTTIFAPVPASAGTQGVTVVSAFFVATNQAAVFFGVAPGRRYLIPLSSRDAGLTWQLLWSDGGPTLAMFATGPVTVADTFDGVAPSWATRLIVAQVGGGFLTTCQWYAAPHEIPLLP